MGLRLRAALARRGLSVPQFAQLGGFEQSLVHKWLRGDQAISSQSMVRITEVLHVTADELLGIAAGQDPDYPAWRDFLSAYGNAVTLDERRTLQSIYWPPGRVPTVASYVVLLQGLRAGTDAELEAS